MQNLKIFVDGSFFRGMYGGGYVVYDGKDIIWQDCGVGKKDPELLSMRNISGEITATMRATNWLSVNNAKGTIVHDYIGIAKWAKLEWSRNKKHTKLYAEYMYPFVQAGVVKFKWVKGHIGIEGNEIADKLAKQAVVYNQEWRL